MCGKEEYKAIDRVVRKSIKTGGWQTAGEADAFEKESARFLGVKYGILTTSGSAAGLLALSALELPKGSEVIIPATTFPTIFNIILQCGLVPVVVDSKVGTYNLDPQELEAAISRKTKAIICVHAVGNPVDMSAVMQIAHKHGIKVIEDNCDGWGSTIKGNKVGSFGDVSITSFHAAHIISTAGTGGGVYTNDPLIARNVRQYRDWGRQADTTQPYRGTDLPADYNPRFIYEKIGYNFQILELQAAMGRVQLRKSDKIKRLRSANFDYLVNSLSKHEQLIMPKVVKGADVCWFALPLTYIGDRGRLVGHLEKNGIETRSMFAGDITKHPAYRDSQYRVSGELTGAGDILKYSFWIGVHPRMTIKELDYVVAVFDDFFRLNA